MIPPLEAHQRRRVCSDADERTEIFDVRVLFCSRDGRDEIFPGDEMLLNRKVVVGRA